MAPKGEGETGISHNASLVAGVRGGGSKVVARDEPGNVVTGHCATTNARTSSRVTLSVSPKLAEEMVAPLRLVEGREGGEPSGAGSVPGSNPSITEQGFASTPPPKHKNLCSRHPPQQALAKEAPREETEVSSRLW
ncbi:hypothetical protein ACOMHN_023731 [Nucella lapillus]